MSSNSGRNPLVVSLEISLYSKRCPLIFPFRAFLFLNESWPTINLEDPISCYRSTSAQPTMRRFSPRHHEPLYTETPHPTRLHPTLWITLSAGGRSIQQTHYHFSSVFDAYNRDRRGEYQRWSATILSLNADGLSSSIPEHDIGLGNRLCSLQQRLCRAQIDIFLYHHLPRPHPTVNRLAIELHTESHQPTPVICPPTSASDSPQAYQWPIDFTSISGG